MHVADKQRTALQPYAWPGGYPIYYLAKDGFRGADTGIVEANPYDRTESVCCAKCAQDTKRWPDLIVIATDINYEDNSLYCDWCSERIESAYSED